MEHKKLILEYYSALMKILENHYVDPAKIDKAKAKALFESIQADSPNLGGYLHGATAQTLWALKDNHVRFTGPMHNNAATKSLTEDIPILPEGKMEAGNIAYFSLPGVSFSERQSGNYIRTANHVLQNLISQNPAGVILDLQNNGGGDCWQMIAAIAPLLDKDHSISFMKENAARTTTIKWNHARHLIECNSANESSTIELLPRSDAPANSSLPVAVIYGPSTNSSGEITALLFRGSPLSKSFGGATGGYSTATTSFEAPFKELFGKAVMHLTTEYIADRNHNVCKGESIEPEIICINPIEQASEWIRALPR